MKPITINELMSYNKEQMSQLNFHFTPSKNEESIDETGLKADIGANSSGELGKEVFPKVCFSQGLQNMLILLNRFANNIDCFIRNNNQKALTEHGFTKEEIYTAITSKSNTIGTLYLFDSAMNNKIYYLLKNLKGCTREEFENMSNKEKEKIDYLSDDYNQENFKKDEKGERTILDPNHLVNKSNMHTLRGKSVPTDKLLKIVDSDGNTLSAFDVAMSLCKKYRELYPDEKFPLRGHNGDRGVFYDDNFLELYYAEKSKQFSQQSILEKEEKINLDGIRETINKNPISLLHFKEVQHQIANQVKTRVIEKNEDKEFKEHSTSSEEIEK